MPVEKITVPHPVTGEPFTALKIEVGLPIAVVVSDGQIRIGRITGLMGTPFKGFYPQAEVTYPNGSRQSAGMFYLREVTPEEETELAKQECAAFAASLIVPVPP